MKSELKNNQILYIIVCTLMMSPFSHDFLKTNVTVSNYMHTVLTQRLVFRRMSKLVDVIIFH